MTASRPQKLLGEDSRGESDIGSICPGTNLNTGGLDVIEIFLEFPHVVEGGADRELLHRSEPVERAANSAGSIPEDTVSPTVVRVLAL